MKNLNKFAALALALVMVFALAACGGSGSTNASTGEGFTGTLKLSHGLTEDHPVQTAMLQMAAEVEEKTNGQIKIEVLANGVLGGEKDNLEQMAAGSLDMAKVSASALESFAPVYQAFSVPYIFNSLEHFYSVMDSEIATELFESTTDLGYKGITWLDSGSRNFYTAKRSINTPDDLKGLKIRTMDSPMAFEMMEAFNGSATTMGFADVYTALQSGVIDGAENNVTATSIHGEVAPYYSFDEHTRIPDIVLISTQTWNKLSAEQQEIIMTAAYNAKETYKVAWNERMDLEKANAEANGVIFTYPDKTPFQEAVKPIYERLASEEPEIWAVCEKIQNAGK